MSCCWLLAVYLGVGLLVFASLYARQESVEWDEVFLGAPVIALAWPLVLALTAGLAVYEWHEARQQRRQQQRRQQQQQQQGDDGGASARHHHHDH